jgi:hypothetical protein
LSNKSEDFGGLVVAKLDDCGRHFWVEANNGENSNVGKVLILENDGMAIGSEMGGILSVEHSIWYKFFICVSFLVVSVDELAHEVHVRGITMEGEGRCLDAAEWAVDGDIL